MRWPGVTANLYQRALPWVSMHVLGRAGDGQGLGPVVVVGGGASARRSGRPSRARDANRDVAPSGNAREAGDTEVARGIGRRRDGAGHRHRAPQHAVRAAGTAEDLEAQGVIVGAVDDPEHVGGRRGGRDGGEQHRCRQVLFRGLIQVAQGQTVLAGRRVEDEELAALCGRVRGPPAAEAVRGDVDHLVEGGEHGSAIARRVRTHWSERVVHGEGRSPKIDVRQPVRAFAVTACHRHAVWHGRDGLVATIIGVGEAVARRGSEREVSDVDRERRRVQSNLGEGRGHGRAGGRSTCGIRTGVDARPELRESQVLRRRVVHVRAVHAESLAVDRQDDVAAVLGRVVEVARIRAVDRDVVTEEQLAPQRLVAVAIGAEEHESDRRPRLGPRIAPRPSSRTRPTGLRSSL